MAAINITLKADRGVDPHVADDIPKIHKKQRNRKRSDRIQAYIDQFAAFKLGDSFFVAGVKRKDMEFLRGPLRAAGLGLLMREVDCDEVYGVAGVRVWRQVGEYDEL